jgi:hypothetical protein
MLSDSGFWVRLLYSYSRIYWVLGWETRGDERDRSKSLQTGGDKTGHLGQVLAVVIFTERVVKRHVPYVVVKSSKIWEGDRGLHVFLSSLMAHLLDLTRESRSGPLTQEKNSTLQFLNFSTFA